jgi:hypothetical protein
MGRGRARARRDRDSGRAHWSTVAAFAVSALHVYTVLWLLGDLHCARHDPPVLSRDALRVTLGFRTRMDIPFDHIDDVTVRVGEAPSGSDYVGVCPMGAPNLLVQLRAPVTARLLFGRNRRCSVVGLAVAEPEAARAELLARVR